jgi:hypothetical protein
MGKDFEPYMLFPVIKSLMESVRMIFPATQTFDTNGKQRLFVLLNMGTVMGVYSSIEAAAVAITHGGGVELFHTICANFETYGRWEAWTLREGSMDAPMEVWQTCEVT